MSDRQMEEVRAYYKSTNFDYEHFWSGQKAQALHFGYFETPKTKHEESLLMMNRKLAELSHVRSNDEVFDAGCGYGGSSMWLASTVGCHVTGMSAVAYQIDKANKLKANLPCASALSFIEGDYARTGLPDESFDVIWGVESIVHSDDKAGFVREAYRLLRPGGRLLIAEYLLREEPPLNEAEMQKMVPFMKGWKMPDLLTSKMYHTYCREAGFGDFVVHDLSERVEPSLKKCHQNAGLALPFIGILRKLHLIDQIRHDYTIANYELYDTFREGLWRYQVIVATK